MCVSSKTESPRPSHLGAETVRARIRSRKRDCLNPAVLRSLSSLLSAVYQALYLEELTLLDLSEKIALLFGITPQQITHVYRQTPGGIHILVSDEVRPLTRQLKGSNEPQTQTREASVRKTKDNRTLQLFQVVQSLREGTSFILSSIRGTTFTFDL